MMYKLSFLELANEGERLCKAGDCAQGIKFFEAALQLYEQNKSTNQMQPANTDGSVNQIVNEQEQFQKQQQQQSVDYPNMIQTVAIIYNQLGNAYFNLQDYTRALDYHKKDLELCEQFGDESGKAKACGNVGNTLQLLGDYDEAIYYLLRNLEISKKLNDSSGEARALYNLANIYQAKGKFMGRLAYNDHNHEPANDEFRSEIREVLLKAVHYYNETLRLVANKERSAEGRTYGNLGNTYYLLGEFDSAIRCHLERLKIAREFGDKAAERRAYSNLGNAHIFQGKILEASEYYQKAMNVARSLGDRAIEAQSYYSLGNAYTLLQDYALSIDFHHRHLQIAQTLDDKIGECRAYWSLGNSYAAMGDLENAIIYANKHLNLAKQIGDSTSELTAKKNLYDFQNLLTSSGFRDSESGLFTPICSNYGRKYLDKTSSRQIQKSASIDSFYTNVTFDRANLAYAQQQQQQQQLPQANGNSMSSNGVGPLRLLNSNRPTATSQGDLSTAKSTSHILPPPPQTPKLPPSHHRSSLTDIENSSKAATIAANAAAAKAALRGGAECDPDLSFLEQITRMQSKRLDDQRCVLKPTQLATTTTATKTAKSNSGPSAAGNSSTIPNEDFFELIMKSQQSRLEDQRSSFSTRRNLAARVGISNNGTTSNTNLSTSSTKTAATDQKSTRNTTSSTTLTSSSSTNSKTYKKQPSTKKSSAPLPINDDFFQLIERVQSRKMDDQRATVKPTNSLFRFGSNSSSGGGNVNTGGRRS